MVQFHHLTLYMYIHCIVVYGLVLQYHRFSILCMINNLFRYDSRKGFFCVVKEGRKKCLGKGKGRSYPPMSMADHQWLDRYYSPHNARLREILTELDRTPPGWLLEQQPH